MLPDLGLLRRRRDFRLLLTAQTVSLAGSMLTMVAAPFQIYALTRSSLAVGALGLAEVLPMVSVALLSGALADVVDRRRQVIVAELVGLASAAVLFANAAVTHSSVAVIYAAVALNGVAYALLRPPLDALVPRVVERDELPAASSIDAAIGSMAAAAGPAIAGVLLATTDLRVLYTVDAVSFVVSMLTYLRMAAAPPAEERRIAPLRDIAEGLRYARSRPELLGTYLVDINAMVFGMPMALFPALAVHWGGAKALGMLFAAPEIGSAIASVTSGWTAGVRRRGRGIVLAAAAWGAAMVGFGLADALWLAVAFLAIAGGMDALSGVFRMTVWNESIPDAMRGRLAGVEMVSWSSGPGLGNLEAGAVASVAGVRASVVSGGVLCVLGSFALAAALPALWRYEPEDQSGGT